MSNQEKESKIKIALGDGDYQDPGRYFERYRAMQYFCDVVTEMVPQCIDDIYALIPFFKAALEKPYDEKLMKELTTKLDAWAHRYRLDREWPRTAAIHSVCHYILMTKERASRPEATKLFPAPKKLLRLDPLLVQREEMGVDTKISDILESVNPGWHDLAYEFIIPPLSISYNPRSIKWSDIQENVKSYYDDQLRSQKERIQKHIDELNMPKSPSPLLDQHVRWYVRWLVLRQSVAEIAESIVDDEKDPPRTRIHYGIDRMAKLTGLATRQEIESQKKDKGSKNRLR